MNPASFLWSFLLLVAFCGALPHVAALDASAASAERVRARVESVDGHVGAPHAPATVAAAPIGDDAGVTYVSHARPALFATAATAETVARLQRQAHRRAGLGDGAWGAALSGDLERLVGVSPIGSLLAPAVAARVAPPAAATAAPAAPAGSRITVAAVGRSDLASRRSRLGGPRARLRGSKQASSAHARSLDEIADAMSWPSDFAEDLTDEDSVYFAFETLGHVGPTATEQKRLAAWTLNRAGERIDAAWFEPATGPGAGYFDREGKALGTMPVPAPCEHVRISSRFSPRRLHPVLRTHRAHSGVDFAAPTGTPVVAVADGVIDLAADLRGASGNVIRLRHDERLVSHYGHLDGFAPGIEKGKTVKRGEVIGYVGSTGLSSGPHLHLGISIDGRFVDPLQARVPRSGRLQGEDLAAYRLQLERIDGAYAQAGLYESSRARVAMSAAD